MLLNMLEKGVENDYVEVPQLLKCYYNLSTKEFS